MRLVLLSDTHTLHRRVKIPDGDVVCHTGDATGQGTLQEIAAFLDWFDRLPHIRKVLIAGNHDFGFESDHGLTRMLLSEHPGITYLQDSGCMIGGLHFWGSPWQPWFMDWAFNLPRKGPRLREKWNMIPLGTDILLTHTGPHGTLDQPHLNREHLGCEELAIRLCTIRPKVHVFGHIHGGAGRMERNGTLYVNASICDEDYRPINEPQVIDL